MNPIKKAYWIGKGVGWDNVPRRLLQAGIVRSGILQKRLSPKAYEENQRRWIGSHEADVRERWKQAQAHFPAGPSTRQLHDLVPAETWTEQVESLCHDALAGRYPFFSRWTGELGWPPNFNLDPVHQIEWPKNTGWVGIAKSGPPRDDIKLVWEASRLSLAFALTRQYRYTKDKSWAESLWALIDSWIEQNPANRSIAWACGQEVAFRLMALIFSAIHTLDSEAATDERLLRLEHLIWQSAKRIQANINYALSQKNNHGISEALGLWTVGKLFPNFYDATCWVEKGMRLLQSEVKRQVYGDGSFVQHSVSYHRVLLDNLSWVKAISAAAGDTLPPLIQEKARLATTWLADFIEEASGSVPNLGTNDGANVLPLSCSDYGDYRPALETSAVLFNTGESRLELGPWTEKLHWLGFPFSPGSNKKVRTESRPKTARKHWGAPLGGYFSLIGPQSRIYLRAANYKDRPGQCDQLHLDLWHRGFNILRDAGSYHYYHADAYLKNYFYSVAAHNTVQVANAEQMVKGPNFLWFHWPQAEATFAGDDELSAKVRVRGDVHYDHTRHIARAGDTYTVRDSVISDTRFSDGFSLRWRLPPGTTWTINDHGKFTSQFDSFDYAIDIDAPGARIELGTCLESKYYGEKRECPMLLVSGATGSVTTRLGSV